MIILSIDSGLEKTGFSILDKNGKSFTFTKSGLIKTDKHENYGKRVLKIYLEIKKIIENFKPEVIVIESLFFFKNHKTAISIGQTQGVIILLAAENNIKLEFLTPLQIKQIVTGYGQADKKSVRKMVEMTVKINKKIKEDDEIDAIACGLAYCYLNKTLLK